MKNHACPECTILKRKLSAAINDEHDVKIKLVRIRTADGPERAAALVERAADAKRQLKQAKVELDEHEAECSVALAKAKPPPFADLSTHYNTERAELPPAIELVAMLNAGMSRQDIANEYGCSYSTVTQRIAHSGLLDKKPEPVAEDEPVDVLAPLEDAAWMADGLCPQADPEIFFPEKGGSTKEAKKVCAECTVSAECLDWAITNKIRFGIWGGKSERERRKLAELLNPVKVTDGEVVGVCALDECDQPITRNLDGYVRKYCGSAHANTGMTRTRAAQKEAS